MPFNIFIFKVDKILYILIGCFLIGLYLLYLIERPKKPKKTSSEPKKPTIWFKNGKEI
jgi:hypothetical protein